MAGKVIKYGWHAVSKYVQARVEKGELAVWQEWSGGEVACAVSMLVVGWRRAVICFSGMSRHVIVSGGTGGAGLSWMTF